MERVTFKFTKKQAYTALINLIENGKLEYEVPATTEVEAHKEKIDYEEMTEFLQHNIGLLDTRAASAKKATKKKAEDKWLDRVYAAVGDNYETRDEIVEKMGLAEDEKFTASMIPARMNTLISQGLVEKSTRKVKDKNAEGKAITRTPVVYRRVHETTVSAE